MTFGYFSIQLNTFENWDKLRAKPNRKKIRFNKVLLKENIVITSRPLVDPSVQSILVYRHGRGFLGCSPHASRMRDTTPDFPAGRCMHGMRSGIPRLHSECCTCFPAGKAYKMASSDLSSPTQMTTVDNKFIHTDSGHILEQIDDDVKDLNIVKGQAKEDSDWATTSKFDEGKDKSQFRDYDGACDRVKNFYKEQHEKQTVAYNLKARLRFKSHVRARMTVWEALMKLNTLIDQSDPDTELSQIEHALQAAQAIRKDGKPRWMQLVGLIHDLGKLLYFFEAEGQWDVVGDTFPVGCAFSEACVYPETFKANPDYDHPIYGTKYGIYPPNCGLDNVMLSWGHDEYIYHVCKDQSTIPKEGLAMLRYHSLYPIHRENGYQYLLNDHDQEMLKAVRAFNPYDLYSKSDELYDLKELTEYYQGIIDEFFPKKIVEW